MWNKALCIRIHSKASLYYSITVKTNSLCEGLGSVQWNEILYRAIIVSERVWKCMTEYGWKDARIVSVKCKAGLCTELWKKVYRMKEGHSNGRYECQGRR